jgi:hypothetical protein
VKAKWSEKWEKTRRNFSTLFHVLNFVHLKIPVESVIIVSFFSDWFVVSDFSDHFCQDPIDNSISRS